MSKYGGTMREQRAFHHFVGWVFVFLLFAPACGREPGLIVNIAAWPDGVERIRVRPTVDSTVGSDIFVNKDQDRFVVRVPASSQGTVKLDATGLDLMGCKLATGSLMEPVPNTLSHFVERTLVLSSLSTPVCVFGPSASVPVGLHPDALAVGDFNGDMRSDVAVANSGGKMDACPSRAVGEGRDTVSVLLGNDQQGAVPAMPLSFSPDSAPDAVAIGDFNGDMKPDLAVALYARNAVSVLLGDGMGGFSDTGSPLLVSPPPSAVVVGDFNRDMKPDLAVLSNSNVTAFLGNGNGGFGALPLFGAGGSGSLGFAVGDLNGDANPDLVVTNSGVNPDSNTVTVFLGDGLGVFRMAKPVKVGLFPRSVAIADFNGDLKPDLAVANFGKGDGIDDGNVSVLLGNGSGGFAVLNGPIVVGKDPYSLVVGDFNKDGLQDIATADYADSTVSLRLGNGMGGFSPTQSFPVGLNPISLAVGDFNGDQLPDLVSANFFACSVSILLNQP